MYCVREIAMANGERISVLCHESGIPCFAPMAWMLTMRRPKNLAANSLRANLLALAFLMNWTEQRGIDLENRFISGEFLHPFEVMNLAGRSKYWAGSNLSFANAKRVVLSDRFVVSKYSCERLRIVANYLEWLVHHGLQAINYERRKEHQRKGGLVVALLRNITPKVKSRTDISGRESIHEECYQKLMQLTEAGGYEIWANRSAQRNCLIINILFQMGLRAGELLKMKITDIDFRLSTLTVTRSPDDPEEIRIRPPQAKTADRILLISDSIMRKLEEYVYGDRNKFTQSRLHPFVFVSSSDGKALSYSALAKLFREMRNRIDWLPDDFTAHIGRHTFATRLASLFEENKTPKGKQEVAWSALMGWKLGSGTESKYTRRHNIMMANEIMLEMQTKVLGRLKEVI